MKANNGVEMHSICRLEMKNKEKVKSAFIGYNITGSLMNNTIKTIK